MFVSFFFINYFSRGIIFLKSFVSFLVFLIDYVLFDKGRITCLESSEDYEKFKKNPRIVNSYNSEYYMMHYKIENNKMYFNLDSYENDPDDYFAFYVLSNKKSSIVLEIRDDATATTGYYHFKVPQEAWHVTLYEDSHYCYTAYYRKEHL